MWTVGTHPGGIYTVSLPLPLLVFVSAFLALVIGGFGAYLVARFGPAVDQRWFAWRLGRAVGRAPRRGPAEYVRPSTSGRRSRSRP